jgi:serine/threonine protein kinase
MQEEFHSRYLLGDKIGKGTYAQVHVARRREAPVSVAVKIRDLHDSRSPNGLDKQVVLSAYKEVCLWSRVGMHCNCVQMHEHFFDDHLCYMVMEKCSYSLIVHLKGLKKVTETSLRIIFTQMLQGLAHIHSLSIVHRDVKPDNFLVAGKNSNTVKLCDFGLAAFVPEGGKVEGLSGTAPYMSPEIVKYREADLKADVWSFGVIVYLLMVGNFPYNGKRITSKSIQKAILKGPSPSFEMPWLTPAARSLLIAVLDRDPLTRPSVEVALRMSFIIASSLKAHSCLHQKLDSAIRLGAFASPDLKQSSTVDDLLADLQEGRIKRNSRVLAQDQMDTFIGATPEKKNQLVESFLSSADSKSRKDSMSSDSTTDAGSPAPSSLYASITI